MKHYFEGMNRVCGKLGGGFSNVDWHEKEESVPCIDSDYLGQHEQQLDGVRTIFSDEMQVETPVVEEHDLYHILMDNELWRNDTEPAFDYAGIYEICGTRCSPK